MQSKYFYLMLIFIFKSNIISTEHAERICFDSKVNIGKYQGIDYQVVYGHEKNFVELECRMCDNDPPIGDDVVWSRINVTKIRGSTIFEPFKTSSKKFKKRMKLMESNGLFIKKAKPKYSGFYNCNITRTVNGTEVLNISITYLLEIIPKKNASVINGTLANYKKYRDTVLDPITLKLDEESLQDQIAKLEVYWTNWGECLCGSFKFDSKRYRYGYPFVSVSESFQHSPIFFIKSKYLQEFYPFFYIIVGNASVFREYDRCVDDCVPDALEEDVKYKYEDSIYLPEGADAKIICPESENATEVLWVFNEETIIHKSDHALGTGIYEKHVGVDTTDILYLRHVRPMESGIYSCLIDSQPMKKIKVHVVAKSIFLSREFLHCVMIIAFVLLGSFLLWLAILIYKISEIRARFQ